jgi:hypothetical protein
MGRIGAQDDRGLAGGGRHWLRERRARVEVVWRCAMARGTSSGLPRNAAFGGGDHCQNWKIDRIGARNMGWARRTSASTCNSMVPNRHEEWASPAMWSLANLP